MFLNTEFPFNNNFSP